MNEETAANPANDQPSAPPGQAPTPPADAKGAPDGSPATDGAAGAPPEPTDADAKPFLGSADAKPADADADAKPADAPKPPDEAAYLAAITKDEAVLGKNDALAFDERLVKAVIPACQRHGIPPAAARDMANAFAKAQVDGAREALKERAAYFQKMNGEARAKYSDGDFAQINKGIDRCFRPGGAMNFVIRNSELGADPEFLALMHRLGAEAREDDGKGAAAGSSGGHGDGNSTEGLSRLW